MLIDDGAVALRVSGVSSSAVTLEVENDGLIESHKGVNLPDTRLPIAAVTAADRELLAWGVGQDVDYVALSFVRCAADVLELKGLIAAAGGDQLVVAKIEKKEALAAYEEIIAAADAVMVARGDLGVEIDPAMVPIWQKRIIHAVPAGVPTGDKYNFDVTRVGGQLDLVASYQVCAFSATRRSITRGAGVRFSGRVQIVPDSGTDTMTLTLFKHAGVVSQPWTWQAKGWTKVTTIRTDGAPRLPPRCPC